MSSKTDTYGSPPEPAVETMPDIRLGVPPPSRCWKVRRREEDGVEELVECSLAELMKNTGGGEIASTVSVVSDWDVFKS